MGMGLQLSLCRKTDSVTSCGDLSWCTAIASASRASSTPKAGISAELLASEGMSPLEVAPEYQIYDLDFYGDGGMNMALQTYYKICLEATDIFVTTSCFTAWRL